MFKNLNRNDSIGKHLNRTYVLLCVLFIGMCSSVFAIDLSQAFSQSSEQSAGIDSIFKGKSMVNNLYTKALKLAKDREVVSTTISFDQLKIYFSTCARVDTADFINILYHSNSSFRTTFKQIFSSSTKKPTTDEIDKSYGKFFTCRSIAKPTSNDIQDLNNEINVVYYDIYARTYTMSTINKDNFGSDLFWNGTLDDSDFDLLYDINQVGKILFDAFTESPEILFYRLPKSPTGSAGSSSSPPQGAYQLGGGGSSFPGTTGVPSGNGSSSPSGGASPGGTTTTTSSSSSSSSSSQNPSPLDDQEVQNFIEKTNPGTVSANPVGVALVFGNQCLTSDTPTPIVQEELPLMTPEEYMSGIDNFIEHANIEDIINTNLLDEFNKNNPLPSGGSTSDSGYADAVVNAYAEQAFGEAAPGTCEYACKDLPLDKQAQCELGCAKSCIQTCDGLGLQDKLLCVSDCTCFLIAGPNGAGWEKMEDMFRIKFCKVTVQQKKLSPGKTVFSIQGIFQEISDVLEGLRDSGQMVKFSKTKEFLDGAIKINFADNFAFKLQVGFKPVFPQKSTTIKRQEQSQANMDLNIAVLDMNASAPDADNYNKYIVVADVNSNDASLEPAGSLAEVNANIQKFTTAANAAQSVKLSVDAINDVISSYAENTKILFVQNMIEFLRDNQSFLHDLTYALLDINVMSLELKTRIENSK